MRDGSLRDDTRGIQYGPDRTILTLALSVPERQNVGRENIPAIIIDYIKKNNKITKKIIATELGLSEKTIEREMKK